MDEVRVHGGSLYGLGRRRGLRMGLETPETERIEVPAPQPLQVPVPEPVREPVGAPAGRQHDV